MSFISWEYAFLLIGTVLIYWQLAPKWRLLFTLVISYFFYGYWDFRFLSLILTSTVIDYFASLGIVGKRNPFYKVFLFSLLPLGWLGFCKVSQIALNTGLNIPKAGLVAAFLFPFIFTFLYMLLWKFPNRPKGFLLLSIISNLSILCFFKYFNFFVESGKNVLSTFGWNIQGPVLEILLPLGISFYTFQSLSYSIDVFRKEVEPIESFSTFATYLSFFPQLVAGPIERCKHLLPQILNPKKLVPQDFHDGARMILIGLFKKIFVADNCALVANYSFSSHSEINAWWSIIGVIAFGFQIYGDFSGYSDIARGSAKWLGVDLMQNFRFPYFSKTPSDFWQRWHISLSSWIRDYLYIPLGGNQRGRWATIRNLLITMFLAGLWHGASWMFVLWGLYHGLLLVMYRIVPALKQFEKSETFGKKVTAIFIMNILIFFGWALFRSQDWGTFMLWLTSFNSWKYKTQVNWLNPLWWLLIHIIPLILLQIATWKEQEETAKLKFSWPVRGIIYTFILLLVVSSTSYDKEFIYFQF
jgi:alginate O-acetyltransferase complex protein AlgI